MQQRRLGRTNLAVSVVGFGTCQLRLVTETQGIDTLLRGFDLGVNLVHTAPDYEGAEDLVARAVARTSKRVIVASQGYDVHHNSNGPVRHFESLFETTCRHSRPTGSTSTASRAWMIARPSGRMSGAGTAWWNSCRRRRPRTPGRHLLHHAATQFVAKLVRSEAFDAAMLAYNELGFHLLSYSPPPGRHFQDLPRNKSEIFPLCKGWTLAS